MGVALTSPSEFVSLVLSGPWIEVKPPPARADGLALCPGREAQRSLRREGSGGLARGAEHSGRKDIPCTCARLGVNYLPVIGILGKPWQEIISIDPRKTRRVSTVLSPRGVTRRRVRPAGKVIDPT